uniref:Bm140 n=1 Tax=Brugia malayi TaxID=6279 RepID=A0A1I9FZW1_BRUMA|nr:Bm140 [Brugia malayi]
MVQFDSKPQVMFTLNPNFHDSGCLFRLNLFRYFETLCFLQQLCFVSPITW